MVFIVKQQDLNNFKRKYFNLSKRLIKNGIFHDSNTVPQHRMLVSSICEWLMQRKITFYTRVFMKTGEIVDIVAPELPRPLIEVRHSELEKNKKYSEEYDHLRIFVDSSDMFKLL